MKTINQIFIALSLFTIGTDSTQATRGDSGQNYTGINQPVETSVNIQDVLAWGLRELDRATVEYALDAGANPFVLHRTNIFLHMVAPYVTSDSLAADLFETKEISPYWLIGARESETQDTKTKVKAMTEFLLEKGISVDRGFVLIQEWPCNFTLRYTFRDQWHYAKKEITDLLWSQESLYCEENWYIKAQQDLVAANEMLTMISKYQPEPDTYVFHYIPKPDVCFFHDLKV